MNPARPYAKLSSLKPGDVLITDAAFTCMSPNTPKIVSMAKVGRGSRGLTAMKHRLFVPCRAGRHMLNGQEDANGRLIGLRRACS